MSRPRGRALYRARGILPLIALVGLLVSFVFVAGIALAGDVASAEARGELGIGASQTQTPVSEGPDVLAEGSVEVPWLETTLYLLTASLIFVGYAFAARRLPWLRPRRRRKS